MLVGPHARGFVLSDCGSYIDTNAKGGCWLANTFESEDTVRLWIIEVILSATL